MKQLRHSNISARHTSRSNTRAANFIVLRLSHCTYIITNFSHSGVHEIYRCIPLGHRWDVILRRNGFILSVSLTRNLATLLEV
jgi:hypothetical protein